MSDQPSIALDESFARETGRLLTVGWVAWMASFLLLAAGHGLTEWREDPALGYGLLAVYTAQTGIGAVGWLMIKRRFTAYPAAAWVALGSNLAIYATEAVYNLRIGGNTAFALTTHLSYLLLSALFIPWGMAFQAAQNLAVLCAYGLALPPGEPPPTDDLLALGAAAAASSIGAAFAHRLRRRLFDRNSSLQQANQRLQAANEQAAGAQRRFRALFEASPDALVVVDAGGAISLVNLQAERLFGYAREELIGKPIDLLVPERLRDRHAGLREGYARDPRARAMGTPLDLRARRKDGGELPVDVRLSPLEAEPGLVVIAAIRDLAERKAAEELQRRAERALRDSEGRFRAMIETAPDPISLSDLESGQYLEVNAAWCAFTGLAREHAVGRRMDELDLWVDPEERRKLGRALKHDGEVRDLDARLRGGGGVVRIGSLSGTRLRLGGREVAMVWTRDVTEQRRAEEALRESEERFRSLATFAPIGIFRADAAGRMVYANPRWLQLTGLGFRESLGEGYAAAIHPEDRPWVVSEWQRCAREAADFDGEFRFQRPDGAVVWVRTTTTPLRSPDGTLVGFIGTNQDISERKAVEQMRTDLIRMLSHDIKNPLSLVIGFADLLRQDLAAGRDPGPALDSMETGARDAMALALDFLEADRIDTGSLKLRKAPASLNEIVEQEVGRQMPRARLRKVELRTDLEAAMPPLDLDEALLGRAVANLLSNAIKFSPAGDSVRVRTGWREGRAAVTVDDAGPGIREEDRGRLFRRYGRAATSDADSTGLGLFVVKTVAEAHGGGVDVRRSPQGGASFEIWLPAPAR